MPQPTKTEAIQRFLIASTHPDLAALYNYNLEVQVNVTQDGGTRVENDYQGRKWHTWTDGVQIWKPIRIPFNAATEPSYIDSEMTFSLEEHAEGIGMTGWDWVHKQSLWFGFDFDKITEHAKGLTEAQLGEVESAATQLPWTTIRRSTSGNGRHIYVFCTPTYTSTHTEHAALGRSVLGIMSALTKFDFQTKIDACGGILWAWHRKMKGTRGLELIKQGLIFTDIPPNWRDHIPVISGKRTRVLPQFIEETESEDLFEQLTGQRPKIQLDDQHKKLIDWLKDNGAVWWWDSDHQMLVSHTIYLKEAHEELGFKGIFKTLSTGKDKGSDINIFMFPLRGGGWVVRRYTPGVAEESTWDQDTSGYTRCFYNRNPDITIAARSNDGIEHTSGGYVFQHAEQAQKAALLLGADLHLPTWAAGKKAKLKEHKDGRLIAELEYDTADKPDEMRGWLNEKKQWKKIFNIQNGTPTEPELGNYDEIVRHVITETGNDYCWMLKSDNEHWNQEPFLHVKAALKGKGWDAKECDIILGGAVTNPWVLVNKPFQSLYPGDREWNIDAAQFRCYPTQEHDNLHYPNWSRILNHLGKGLDDALKDNDWAKDNNIKFGSDYLKLWIASLLQYPSDHLPYLFFYGPQNSGKSILHESLKLLVTHGVDRADVAIKSKSYFNEELQNLVLCIIEETDLKRDKEAYNKIKDWVNSKTILIHGKGRKPFSIPNRTHWIHCSNDFSSCPVFSGDTRITIIEVQPLSKEELIPKKQFEKLLEKEAPDFLASVLSLELPVSPDRLNVPVIVTEQKTQLERANQSYLEAFIAENCFEVTGKYIMFGEFCDRFWEWVGTNTAMEWSKIRVSKELPPKYPAARIPQTGYKAIGNLSWEAFKVGDPILPRLVVRNDKLVTHEE